MTSKLKSAFFNVKPRQESRNVGATLNTLSVATRAYYLPVLITPLAIGVLLAWRDGNKPRPFIFGLTVLGASAAHLASNLTNDYYDYLKGTESVPAGDAVQ